MLSNADERNVPRGDHLKRTEKQTRQDDTIHATISRIEAISPTVKKLTLKVDGSAQTPSFRAGQWVDFFAPDVAQVGGYSMCSSPSTLDTLGELQLAVKRSTWPPAVWIHQEAAVGSRVALKIGGDFHYPNEKISQTTHNILLVAGGIGINPIFSILQHLMELKSKSIQRDVQVSLLYSSKFLNELVFREEINSMPDKSFSKTFFVTRDVASHCHTDDLLPRRMCKADVTQALGNLDASKQTFCYICGPNQMILDVTAWLKDEGLHAENIFYELWW